MNGQSAPQNTTQVHWASGLNILAGLWLVIAPFALAYGADATGAAWNDVAIGATVAVLAMVRVAAPLQFESVSWVNFVLGGWLLFAPFVIGYSDNGTAVTNDIVMGLIVLSLAAWSAWAARQRTGAPAARRTPNEPSRQL
jgi:hypothetical protein